MYLYINLIYCICLIIIYCCKMISPVHPHSTLHTHTHTQTHPPHPGCQKRRFITYTHDMTLMSRYKGASLTKKMFSFGHCPNYPHAMQCPKENIFYQRCSLRDCYFVYSIHWVLEALCICLCQLCVSLSFCKYLSRSLSSPDDKLSENICFVWPKTSYDGDKWRCYHGDKQTTKSENRASQPFDCWTA